MLLPLCTPDKIECVENIETKYKECLPQCSGVWILGLLSKPLVSREKLKITKLSKQYWNYKGFYKFPIHEGKVLDVR